MALCAHIGRRLAALPVLFVLTRRDRPDRPDADALLADLAGRGVEVAELELGPLADGRARRGRPQRGRPDRRRTSPRWSAPPTATRCWRWRAPAPSPAGSAMPRREPAGRRPGGARGAAPPGAGAGRDARRGRPELSAAELRGDSVRRDRPDAERRGAGHRAGSSGCAAGCASGTRCSPRRPAPTWATPDARHEPSRSPSRRPPSTATRWPPRSPGTCTGPGRDDLAGPRWRRAARHARSLGALPEAARSGTEAVRCDPDAARACAWSWPRSTAGSAGSATSSASGRRRSSVSPTNGSRWPGAAAAAARARWCATRPAVAGRLPAGAELLGRGRAAVAAGARCCSGWPGASRRPATPARSAAAARRGRRAGPPSPTTRRVAEIENARLMAVIRLGRFAECEAVADAAARRPPRACGRTSAYAVWIRPPARWRVPATSTARCGRRSRASRRPAGVPVLELPCLAARALLLSRLGRHDEALSRPREQLAHGRAAGLARDRGAGPPRRRAGRAGRGPPSRGGRPARRRARWPRRRISRPAARLARAEALAARGRPDEAAAEVRRAALEPVRPAATSRGRWCRGWHGCRA